MKKIKFYLALIVMFAVGLLIVGCNHKKENNIKNLENDNSLLAFYSLTSAGILNDGSTLQRQAVKRNLSTGTIEEVNMEAVNSYMQMMESMFSENPPVVIKNETSDRTEYTNMLVFEATDLSGKKELYTIYFNQTELVDDDDDFEDRFENEVEYKIEGIAIIEGIEYQIIGETETEDNEQSLDIVVKLDEKNYVVIEQEIENNEEEYEYTVYKDGRKFTSIEFEVENQNEFEAEFITNEKGYTERYRFYKEGNEVRIRYQSNDQSFTIKATASVDPNTNETIYDYKVVETNKEYRFKD